MENFSVATRRPFMKTPKEPASTILLPGASFSYLYPYPCPKPPGRREQQEPRDSQYQRRSKLHISPSLMQEIRGFYPRPSARMVFRRHRVHILAGGFDPQCRRQIARAAGLVKPPEFLAARAATDDSMAAPCSGGTILPPAHPEIRWETQPPSAVRRCSPARNAPPPTATTFGEAPKSRINDRKAACSISRNAASPDCSKDVRNGSPLPRLDAIVQIFERPSQLTAQSQAHAALAGTHEAHEKYRRAPRSEARSQTLALRSRAAHRIRCSFITAVGGRHCRVPLRSHFYGLF